MSAIVVGVGIENEGETEMTKKMTAAEKALKAVLRAERPTATPAQKAKAHRIWASAYEHSNTVTKR